MTSPSYPCGLGPQLGRDPRRAVSVCLRSSVEDMAMRKLVGFIRTHAKKCVMAFVGLLGLSALAEGAVGDKPDLKPAVDALTTMKDVIVGQDGWISQAAPVLALLLGGLLVVTLIWVAFRWVTRGTRRA